MWYWFDETKPVPRVRAGKRSVTASINRPARLQLQGREGVEQARGDVIALFEKIRTRFGLAALPSLSSPDVLAALPPALLHDDDPRNDVGLLASVDGVRNPAQMNELREALKQTEWVPRDYAPPTTVDPLDTGR